MSKNLNEWDIQEVGELASFFKPHPSFAAKHEGKSRRFKRPAVPSSNFARKTALRAVGALTNELHEPRGIDLHCTKCFINPNTGQVVRIAFFGTQKSA